MLCTSFTLFYLSTTKQYYCKSVLRINEDNCILEDF